MQKTFALVLALVFALGSGRAAWAQDGDDSYTEKWYLHAHLQAQSQDLGNADDVDGGGGFGVRAGYGVSPLATLYTGLSFSSMSTEAALSEQNLGDEYGLVTFELGSQFNFRRGKKWVPFFDAAIIGVASASNEDDRDVNVSGGGLGVGGGVKYFISPEFALDAGFYSSVGDYSDSDVDGDSRDISLAFNNGRLAFGFSWYPSR